MQNKSITKLNKTAIFCLLLFSIITLIRIFNRVPWFDEAHAWTISEQLNYFDMLKYIKNEGHFFVWQTILYPFAKLHLYPYSMQILNWLFCFVALIVMWWKAPFHNIIKVFITFSFPFLGCYGLIARCYSIGIMFLFILAALHENRLKYPKTYATMLILCANTSIMALIGATLLGGEFLFNIFRNKLNKKDFILTGLILFLGAILVFIQVFSNIYFSEVSMNSPVSTSFIMLFNTYIYHNFWINFILNAIFMILISIYLWDKKQALIFFIVSFFLMLVLAFNFYGLNFWHSYFFFIYLIISLWIADKKDDKSLKKKISTWIFAIISCLLVFHIPEESNFSSVFHSDVRPIFDLIENDEILNKAVLIHNSGYLYEMIPYISKKTYKIKNYCTVEDNTDYDLMNSHLGTCVRGNIFGQAQKYPDIIKKIVENNNNNVYACTDITKNPQVRDYGVIFADGYNILIKKYKCKGNLCFWKVEINDKN